MSQPPGSLDHQIGYAVKRVQQRVRLAGDEALRPYGLSMPQYAVLAVLAETPGVSGSELARRCFVTRQTMNEVIGGLLSLELVERSDHAGSGRARPLALTGAGRATVHDARSAVDRIEHRMSAALRDADRRRLLDLLDTCAGALEEGVATPERPGPGGGDRR